MEHFSMIPYGNGFGGNYGYNSRQQFGDCTPPVNFVSLGILLYPRTNFCTPSDKSVPQEVPGIPGLSVIQIGIYRSIRSISLSGQ